MESSSAGPTGAGLNAGGLVDDRIAPEQRRALIAEDDGAIRRLVTKLLTRQGIAVDAVADGRSAIEHVRDNSYSVIVLDLMLPEVNGFEVLDYIRATGIRAPVAVVSAVSNQALTRLDLDLVKLVISKPFDVDEFTKAVVGLCNDRAD